MSEQDSHAFETVQVLLKDLANRLEMPEFIFDENHMTALIFDDSLLIMLQINIKDESLLFFAPIAETNLEDSGHIYPRLLAANCFWQETHGATLSMDPDTQAIVLAQTLPWANLDYPTLEQTLELFVSTTEHWMQQIPLLPKNSTNQMQPTKVAEVPLGDRLRMMV